MSYTNGLDKPTDYFETVTYSGNGTGQDITTLDFQPDWLWIKRRNAVGSHRIQDSIRGTTNYLQSDKTDAEASGGDVDAFLSNGFSLSGGATAYNVSGGTYVGWSWLGGGTGVSNTDGSITSSVSANTTAGFSIVSYSGSTNSTFTVGHGLSAVPKIFILKKRSSSGTNWVMYNANLGNDKRIQLNNTDASAGTSGYGNTDPTSSVFTVANGSTTGADGQTYIAYCFAEKKGYSKFGSYTGNGNADGTFIYTGFKPAFMISKRTDVADDWNLHDSKRPEFNPTNKFLEPNTSDAEAERTIDFLSNGIKLYTANAGYNASGGSYIYMCFAENPFTTSTGIPTTAR